ncbi:helix-turn-helix transcriptional regulator [Rhizobium lusitanum]|uniref:helix-turn-helix transcriptional regulator n=1 Tax=Rhizobium lusitanum TaxID=293958 RepID=UPI001957E439|nr:helix-turn-helix transcriptional regulator [Rhizobium lusitanum]MBM7048367.1 helix-turn-helix transcriptional regulator [Rhizobium lusitanum]
MSFQFDLDPREEASISLIADVAANLRNAVNTYRERTGVNQSDIAAKLDVDRALLTKCLSGFRNITLRTLSDIAWAIGSKVEINIVMPAVVQTAQVFNIDDFTGTANSFFVAEQSSSHHLEQTSAIQEQNVLEHAS